MDFELFRPELNAALGYTDRTEGGRPPFDPVLMFKILVIQAANNLSDERAEFLINDRLSFMRFLGLGLEDRVPDARTIWLFREKLTTAGAIKRLFERFDAVLRQAGYIAMSGQIVDASLVAAPRQRNTDDEKKAIKEGRIPPNWKTKPAKLRHKDRDARWTVKFSKAKPRAGWLNAASRSRNPALWLSEPCLDRSRFGLIRRWAATDAAAYEGRRLRQGLLDKQQYGERGVGRYRLPLGGQRRVPEQEWLRQPHPSQEAERPPDARDDAAGQQCEIENPLACRACLRRAKGSDGAIYPNYRDRPSNDQDRNGQSRLQHQTLYLPARGRRRMTALCYAGRLFNLNTDQAKSMAGFRGHPSR